MKLTTDYTINGTVVNKEEFLIAGCVVYTHDTSGVSVLTFYLVDESNGELVDTFYVEADCLIGEGYIADYGKED